MASCGPFWRPLRGRLRRAKIEQLGGVLAASPASAAAVLDALAAEKSIEAATVAAELVYAMAARIGGRRLTDERGWRPVIEKGAALAGHEDPLCAWHRRVGVDRRPRR